MKSFSELVRRPLKRVPGLKSGYYLTIALRQMIADQWESPASFDQIFRNQEDPWASQSETEVTRFALTMSMIEAARQERFDRAVELGCAEGVFTEKLSRICADLDALDYSEVALSRARKRVRSPNVKFRRWNMRTDALDTGYDLIVAMGVITSLYRPADVRRTCESIIAAMAPHGFLVFSDVRQSRVFERAWWGRFVLRGGEQIRRLFARRKDLALIATADTETHVFALFQKSAAA